MVVRRHQFQGAALGFAATGIVAVLYLLGVLEPFERQALDWRQVVANQFDVHKDIVHVDIDDSAITNVGRWPWSRDEVAQLIDVIGLAGARAIAIDFLFDEPERPRVKPRRAIFDPGGIEGSVSQRLIGDQGRIVVPDVLLAQSYRAAGNVFQGVQVALRTAPSRGWWASFIGGEGPSRMERAREAARRELKRLLVEDFTQDDAALERAWRIAIRDVESDVGEFPLDHILAGVKKEAAQLLVAPLVNQNPEIGFADICRALGFNEEAIGIRDRKDLIAAVQRCRSLLTLERRLAHVPPAILAEARLQEAVDPVVPYYLIAEAVRGFGIVTVEIDPGGHMRRLPVVSILNGRAAPHLGLAVLSDALKLRLDKMELRGRTLEIPAEAGPTRLFRVPIDDEGRLLLHWSPSEVHWAQQPRHIAAGRLIQLARDLEGMHQNDSAEVEAIERVLNFTYRTGRSDDGKPVYAARHAELRDRLERWYLERDTLRQRTLREGEQFEGLRGQMEEVAALGRQLQQELETALPRIRENFESFTPDAPPEDDEERALKAELDDIMFCLDALPRHRAANERLWTEAAALMNDLRPRLQGRYVFVGFTSTAHGDIVTTAVDARLPGVIAHATVANMFLSDRFLYTLHPALEVLIIIGFGVLATLVTATRDFTGTFIMVGSMLVGYAVINMFVIFRAWDYTVELVGVGTVILGSSIPVSFHRWWTSDRMRRQIRAQFGQYTSPALANRIADDPDARLLLTRVENREVTCFFSDLKGFTTIAEQTDPEVTRTVLNIYLDRMSEVLDAHRALINKFMGDGIFAFFNSSVLPQEKDHPREACRAALECQEVLRRMREQPPSDGAIGELIRKFEMRIGLASGVAGVGDFGSSRKKDYTVIGDVANLAARLEPANKVFGTSLLISGSTRDAVSDEYEFRYLAELQVKGKHRTVPVFELLGPKGNVQKTELEWAERFAVGVELYKKRKWDECITHFTRMLARRFDDAGAGAYIAACEEKKAFPPDDDWVGALELKEK